MNSTNKVTTNHTEIRNWVESRNGKPAKVKDTGILRFDFPGYSGEDALQHISWDEFFEEFEKSKLALIYQNQTAGGDESRFNKLISRDHVDNDV